MTYDPTIPKITESPKNSATPIQTNFAQFASIFSNISGGVTYNHEGFSGAGSLNLGKHAVVLMERQTTDPLITGDWVTLYNKNATATTGGTQPQLFARVPQFLPTEIDTSNAPNTPMQLTYNSVSTSAPIYQSFTFGGYLIYFGARATSPIGFSLTPAPTSILSVAVSSNTGIPDYFVNVSGTTLTINTTTGVSINVLWMAIAKA